MSTQSTRRSSFSSSTTSSLAKRHATVAASENSGKFAGAASMAKKRAPLSNITNQKNVSGRSIAPSTLVPFSNKIAKAKRAQPENVSKTAFSRDVLPASVNVKPSSALPQISALVRNFGINNTSSNMSSFTRTHAPRSMDVSPSKSDGQSVSMDESMSTDSTSDSDSFQSPEIEYLDNNDVPAVDSIRRKTLSDLYISDHVETIGNICNRDVLAEDMEVDGKVVNIDDDYMDPQLCATFACDIYKHLRASEVKKRPSKFFMETVQKDINVNMRAILIDWLVEVAEEYRLVPDTLYLTVNYIDRYLSGNSMNRQRLQLLGVACMMIAAKYEEICAPQVEEFCYITDNTYFKDEVLEMESAVLNYLKFEMTTPTPKSFLKRFVRAAQGINEDPTLQLECLANYIAELSLIEYSMLCYAPSLIAASAIFLAKFMLLPSKRPWNSTLRHYTLYEPSDLLHCVNDLHRLCLNNNDSTLPAVREKYSLHKYKCVAKKYCPPSIHPEFFHNQMH